MEKLLLDKSALPDVVARLAKTTAVHAPVLEDGRALFARLEEGRAPHLSFANTKDAPKRFFFPQTETLMSYRQTGRGVELEDAPTGAEETVLFGVRPCDARSFTLLDHLFDGDTYRDPYYLAKRAQTTVVALACAEVPYSTCFCTSVGAGPTAAEGADVLVTDLGEEFLVEFLTEKGERLRPHFGQNPAAGSEIEARRAAVKQKAEAQITHQLPAAQAKQALDAHFDHPFWDTIHGKCLACGTCSYLCPTCHCFDISDQMKGTNGVRIRTWDSCMFPLFTLETSGHNPRPSQKQRWRQRVMHKFRYFVDNFGAPACVGCGRCVQNCPAGADLRTVLQEVAEL